MDAKPTVRKHTVWSKNHVRHLRWEPGHDNMELAVLDTVPHWEYTRILETAHDAGFSIVNKRDCPYYDRVVWVLINILEQVVFLERKFEGQIVLIMVAPCVTASEYQEIVYHSVAKGFIVLNTGPWRKQYFAPRDNAIFEAQLLKTDNQIRREIEKREEALASIEEMKRGRDETVLGFFAEAYGRALAYAEKGGIPDPVIECKRKEISQLQDKLMHYETLIENFSTQHWESLKVICSCSESKEAAGASNNFNGMEIFQLQEKLQHHKVPSNMCKRRTTGPSFMHRRKTKKILMWSFIGISTSLWLSMLVYAYHQQVGEHHTSCKSSAST